MVLFPNALDEPKIGNVAILTVLPILPVAVWVSWHYFADTWTFPRPGRSFLLSCKRGFLMSRFNFFRTRSTASYFLCCIAAVFSITACVCAPLHAAVVLSYPFNNSADGQNGFAPSAFDSSVLASQAVTKGPGLNQYALSFESNLNATVLKVGPGTSVTGATAADALSNDWYFSIALTPHSTMDINSIEMDWSRSGNTGIRGWFVRSSQDNYATNLYSNETPNGTAVGLQHVSFSLSGFSGIGATEFRVYIYTSTNGRYMGFQNVQFNGPSGAPVPEPSTLAIFGLGSLGVAYRARRKAKA
jgi:hypothetical protein